LGVSWLVVNGGSRGATRDTEGSWARSALLEIATPFQKAIEFPLEIVTDFWAGYLALVDVRANNEALRTRIAILEGENLQYREALIESENLDRIGQMRSELATPMRPAQVVGQDISPWFRSLLLDRGQRDRVRSGMPVIVEQGLVGLVTASTPNASRTMLLLDAQSAVDAIIQRSRARGIVRGSRDGLSFEFYVRGDDVAVGDAVMTSGFGGVYPKALRIGEVSAVYTDKELLVHRAEVTPAVDFGRLEQVFVLLWRGPSIELLYRGDGDLAEGPTR
jgi:rod shape-determining protein MreC